MSRREFHRLLDSGEAATLAYALEANADLVLLDEREARHTARRHGLSMTGVVGILLRETGFWPSDDLYEAVLERANET